MTSPLELQDLAIEIATEAGELALRRRREGVSIAASKSTIADIVTEADREVEALIRSRLSDARPEDGFLGEETGGAEGDSGVIWVVDPIDGTVNYAFGMPSYAVSIAAVEGSRDPGQWRALAGAVHAPALGDTFHAAAGEGAWLDGERLRVTGDTPAGALIGTGLGYDQSTHAGDLEMLTRVMPVARDIRRIGAASLDLAFVAAGRLDGYFERGLQPWDIAAGRLLVDEAGGRTGWFEPDAHGRSLAIVAGPALYEELRRRILG